MSFLLSSLAAVLHRFAAIRTMHFSGASRFGASLCVLKFWRSCVQIYKNQAGYVHVWTLACNTECWCIVSVYVIFHFFTCFMNFPVEVIVCVSNGNETWILCFLLSLAVWDDSFLCFDLKTRVSKLFMKLVRNNLRVKGWMSGFCKCPGNSVWE